MSEQAAQPAPVSAVHGDALRDMLRRGWAPLPKRTLVAMALGAVKVRLTRSMVTMLSVVLAIAFLTYTGLSHRLADSLRAAAARFAAVAPLQPAEVAGAASALAAVPDPFAGLDLGRQKAAAKALGLGATESIEADVLAEPAKVTKSEDERAKAEKRVNDTQADNTAAPGDLERARADLAKAEVRVREERDHAAQLDAKLAQAKWIRSGDAGTPAAQAALGESLRARSHELFTQAASPGRLSLDDLDAVQGLLALPSLAGTPQAKTMSVVIGQERDNRAQAELVTLMRANGVSTTAAPNAVLMDRWIILMAVLTCVIGITNAMLMSVTERFREIGTMKCLGAQDALVIQLFLLESAFLGVVGAALGIVVGVLVSFGAAWMQFKQFGVANFPWGSSLGVIASSVLGGVLITVAGAAWPAYQASRMKPVDALRVDE